MCVYVLCVCIYEYIRYITRHVMVKSVLGDNVELTASKLTREVGVLCVCVCMCM